MTEQQQEQAALLSEALFGQIVRAVCLLPQNLLEKLERDFDAELLSRELYSPRIGVAETIAATIADTQTVYHCQVGRVFGKISYFADLEWRETLVRRLIDDLREAGIILDGEGE